MVARQIAVAGNIGVGKSGLCVELADRFDARAELEDVAANPHFESFYADPRRWAFSSQLAFAAESAARHIRAQDGASVVMDRTVYEGVAVFARLLTLRGDLQAAQLEVLEQMASAVRDFPCQPQILLHLTAPPAILAERIQARARRGETKIDTAYLIELDSLYVEFVANWDLCPIIAVDTVERDLRTAAEIDRLVAQVRAHLAEVEGDPRSV